MLEVSYSNGVFEGKYDSVNGPRYIAHTVLGVIIHAGQRLGLRAVVNDSAREAEAKGKASRFKR